MGLSDTTDQGQRLTRSRNVPVVLPRQRGWAILLPIGFALYTGWAVINLDGISLAINVIGGSLATITQLFLLVWPGPRASFDYRYLYVHRMSAWRGGPRKVLLSDIGSVDVRHGPERRLENGFSRSVVVIEVGDDVIVLADLRRGDAERFVSALRMALA